jgi:hypothetical protein
MAACLWRYWRIISLEVAWIPTAGITGGTLTIMPTTPEDAMNVRNGASVKGFAEAISIHANVEASMKIPRTTSELWAVCVGYRDGLFRGIGELTDEEKTSLDT